MQGEDEGLHPRSRQRQAAGDLDAVEVGYRDVEVDHVGIEGGSPIPGRRGCWPLECLGCTL